MTTPAQMDGRLGRRFAGHDERSRAYGIAPLLGSVQRKPTFWAFPRFTAAPVDQMAEGSCTAHAMAHELGAGPVQVPGMTSRWARNFYPKVQATDRAMGNNWPDGASMLALAKTAKTYGYISGYRWAFGIDQVVAALCSVGPVLLGIPWLAQMYEAPGGVVTVAGDVVGGHAITAVGYDEHPQLGPVVVWANSWGRFYGAADKRLNLRGGVGYIRVADLATLLRQDGEAIIAADFVKPAAP